MNWIDVREKKPDRKEPIVYCKKAKHHATKWHVGIAYWTVSGKWNPEMNSVAAPDGFTHWIPLPPIPG